MNQQHIEQIAAELKLKTNQVHATALLIEDGATVPFISRYRKEATGSLDEVAVTEIRDRLTKLAELDARSDTIIKSLDERNLLTDALSEKIAKAQTMTELEDIYLPFRPKRRTRAGIAREKGLEPLAHLLFEQDMQIDPEKEAASFVNAEKGVESVDDALAGARDIIAETVNEDQPARQTIRKLFFDHGVFTSKIISGKEEDGRKYENYYDWTEPVNSAPSHRVLAMRRGEKEGFLLLRVTAPEEKALDILNRLFVKNDCPAAKQVAQAVHDSYKRLLAPSIETEIRLATKKSADQTAIKVFAENLRQLLLASPLGQKNVLAIDPGFRTGCKVVCLDQQGKLVGTDVIYPHQSARQAQADTEKIKTLCEKHKIEAIAIGNGTAGRETETFINAIGLPRNIDVVMVNESGASVYSASEVARREFPDHDLTVRGSVSIDKLEIGMKLPGIVTNITAFGAFVDVGVHQDGLVHISQLADRFVKEPADIVKLQQKVTVTILEIDKPRNRIALSMKGEKSPPPPKKHKKTTAAKAQKTKPPKKLIDRLTLGN